MHNCGYRALCEFTENGKYLFFTSGTCICEYFLNGADIQRSLKLSSQTHEFLANLRQIYQSENFVLICLDFKFKPTKDKLLYCISPGVIYIICH